MSSSDLKTMLEPESAVVFGVSLSNENSIGSTVFRNLKRMGTEVYAVNPKPTDRENFYRDIEDLPRIPDLAIVSLPANKVLGVMEKVIDKGVRSAIIQSSGFREGGKEGAEMERELASIIENSDIRVLGPNTMGILDNISGLDTFFVSEDIIKRPRQGMVTFISQSGYLALPFLETLNEMHVGLRAFVGLGNKVDIDENELLEYFGRQGDSVLAFYIETFTDGRRFYGLSKKVTPHSPIVLLKGGRSERGSKAVQSHTGNIAKTSGKLLDGMMKQAGIIKAEDERELVEFSTALSCYKPLTRGNIAEVSSAGSMGIIVSDLIEKSGSDLSIADLSQDTIEKLETVVSPLGSVTNPIDLTPEVDNRTLLRTIEILDGDPNLDAVLLCLSKAINLDDPSISDITAIYPSLSKPLVITLHGGANADKWRKGFHEIGIPIFDSTGRAVKVLEILRERGKYLEKVKERGG
ncbi:MAG: CoA-binding protein [Thermoplasmata archaeon]